MEERQQRRDAEPAELGHLEEAAHPVRLLAQLVSVPAKGRTFYVVGLI